MLARTPDADMPENAKQNPDPWWIQAENQIGELLPSLRMLEYTLLWRNAFPPQVSAERMRLARSQLLLKLFTDPQQGLLSRLAENPSLTALAKTVVDFHYYTLKGLVPTLAEWKRLPRYDVVGTTQAERFAIRALTVFSDDGDDGSEVATTLNYVVKALTHTEDAAVRPPLNFSGQREEILSYAKAREAARKAAEAASKKASSVYGLWFADELLMLYQECHKPMVLPDKPA